MNDTYFWLFWELLSVITDRASHVVTSNMTISTVYRLYKVGGWGKKMSLLISSLCLTVSLLSFGYCTFNCLLFIMLNVFIIFGGKLIFAVLKVYHTETL